MYWPRGGYVQSEGQLDSAIRGLKVEILRSFVPKMNMMDQVRLQGLKLAIRLNPEALVMSVDTLHVIAAILFLGVWMFVTLLLRSIHIDEPRPPIQNQDSIY